MAIRAQQRQMTGVILKLSRRMVLFILDEDVLEIIVLKLV